MGRFIDRTDAGRRLAALLEPYDDRDDVVVLGLPRGGVPVAYEVARALGAPLDVFVVRKLGVPGQEELGVGAIASGNVRYVDEALAARVGLRGSDIARIEQRERRELDRRESAYRDGRPHEPLAGTTVIVVDDGIATGASMKVAIIALRASAPARIVLAVPVASPDAVATFERLADEVVAVAVEPDLVAVGLWYDDFSQTSDEEVRTLLRRAREGRSATR